MKRSAVLVIGMLAASACAFGGKPDGDEANDGAWVPGNGESSGESGDPQPDDGDDAADDAPADGGCDECLDAPGDCWIAESGRCEDGACAFDPQLAGEPCMDDCDSPGFCDASGSCICSGSGDGGGDCESTCIAGPHSTAACDEAGACIVTCESPWEDCDGDPTTGCEVPVGMPHQCDAGGLNPTGGCWTAYCGDNPAAAASFGTYHCMDCPTCTELAGGQCHWCNHDTGNFYPTEVCSCGAEYLNVACGQG